LSEGLTFISALPLALSTEDLLDASLGPGATPGLAGATLALGLAPVALVVVVTEGPPALGTAGLAPDVEVLGVPSTREVGRVALIEAGAGAKLALALDEVTGKVPVVVGILGLLAPEAFPDAPLTAAAVPLTLCADDPAAAAFVCPAGRVEVGLKGSFNLVVLAVAVDVVVVVLRGFGGGASDTLARAAGAAAVPVTARSRVGALVTTFGEGGTVRGAVMPGRAVPVRPTREVEAERAGVRVGALTPGV
jgi:hypothetical protein